MSDSHVVAVIDDDLAVLESLKFLLELSGFKVAAYSSASAFLDDRGTDPVCLIVDQHMPAMTGLELVGRLRADGPSVPVLLITGSPSPNILARAAQLGVAAVMEKPTGEGDILRFVRSHA
jgi:two-component system response regulator FixJ